MIRNLLAPAILVLFLGSAAIAADKELMAKLIKADAEKKVLAVKTDDGEKTFDVNDDTKFIGPKGGVSDKGIKDERLVKDVELKLVIAGNNRTLREVLIPEKKKK